MKKSEYVKEQSSQYTGMGLDMPEIEAKVARDVRMSRSSLDSRGNRRAERPPLTVHGISRQLAVLDREKWQLSYAWLEAQGKRGSA